MARGIACGIDFGTSNSTVSVTDERGTRLIRLEDDKTTLPSAMFFAKGTAPLFGRAATRAYMDGEDGRFMRGLKKILGTSLMNEKTLIGSKTVSFIEILGTFLNHLKDKAEQETGREIHHVVMGRPVHFHDNDTEADQASQDVLKNIAQQAGFTDVEFLYEPIAAAFAHESQFEDEKLSLVIDLGGGTSDFTVMRLAKARMQNHDRRDDILATSGVRVGGTTFDSKLSLREFMPELGMGSEFRDLFDKNKRYTMPNSVYIQLSDWALANFAQTKKAIAETMDIRPRSFVPEKIERLLKLQKNHLGHALLAEAENVKIALTDHEKTTALFSDLEMERVITRASFEEAITADTDRVFSSMDECLNKAQITSDKVDLVILTGGSTELPIINQIVAQRFPKAVLSQGNKLDSVGLGLAYRAANIF